MTRTISPIDEDLLDVATSLVRRAGQLALQWFQSSDLAIERKVDGSPVTEADKAVEAFLRSELEKLFPDDAIVGEEHEDTAGSSGRTWVIDPIDGTKAFTRGVPLFTNLLALNDEQGPAIGIVNAPAANELVAAGRGLGCTWNGSPCGVSTKNNLRGAVVTTSGYDYWKKADVDAVYASGAQMRTWGDGYGYILVATGRAEAMIDPGLKPWDVAPMNVIIPEAGGTITNFSAQDRPDAGDIVASNGLIHSDVLALLQ
ncbi:MAG: inositol monophosphatase family protein [Acidimicrobiales bacterium]